MKAWTVLRVVAIGGVWLGLTITVEAKTKVTSQPFGKMPDGTPVEIYTLSDGGFEARIATYGGVVVSLKAPDRNGKTADVVLGFDDLDGYVSNFNGPANAFFWGHHWALRESHRARQLHSGWAEIFLAS